MSMNRRDLSDIDDTAADLRGMPPEIAASFGELREIETRLNAMLREARQIIEASRASLDTPRAGGLAHAARPGHAVAGEEARSGREERRFR